MSDENERSGASAGSVKCEPAAWGVMRVGGGWRCIVDSEQQAESLRKGWDRAENWVHEAIPLYRSPTLTDAEVTFLRRERDLLDADDKGDRKTLEIIAGLLDRLGGWR